MTPAQIAELLGMCAAFDRRTVGRADVTAWHLVLGDLDNHDAQQAVADHYRETREWIMPADVRRGVKTIREARIIATNPLYDGNPEETGEQSGRSIRALVDDAASGRLPVRPIRAALEPGENRVITSRERAMLAVPGQHIPSPRAGVVNVLGVPCPICLAQPGRTCRSRRKANRADVHPARLENARRIAAGQPPVDPSEAEAEQRQRLEAARRVLEIEGPTAFVPPTRDELEAAKAEQAS